MNHAVLLVITTNVGRCTHHYQAEHDHQPLLGARATVACKLLKHHVSSTMDFCQLSLLVPTVECRSAQLG